MELQNIRRLAVFKMRNSIPDSRAALDRMPAMPELDSFSLK